jgi:UDP-N-acetylmuramoylalanine--D-glutamate ligase
MIGAFAGERAVVIGFGVSGRAAAEVLRAEGADVWVSEARAEADLDDRPTGGQVRVLAGGHRPDHLDGATMVVASPGVPQVADVIRWALERGLPVVSELELGARLCRVPYVAVTGTNGKTTTIELVAAMLKASGLEARACGNVGYPFSLAARDPSVEALAVEASSFQLALHQRFHPRVSVLLNVAPDHLDWHGSFDDYARAKARIFELQGPGDVHVGNRDDPRAAEISERAPCPMRWFRSTAPGDDEVGVDGGRVVSRVHGDLGRPRARTRSFLADAAAAAAASLAFGLDPEPVRAALESFRPLSHRGAVVATIGSIRFVDDSKATNPHAALAAMDGLADGVLIAGGLAKGVDLSPLAAAAPRLAAVVAIGQAAPAVVQVFDGLVPVRTAASMDEAVAVAFELAPEGGTVLLAPACASQDMFRDYRQRGDRFAEAVRRLEAGASGSSSVATEDGRTQVSHG